MLIGFSCLPSGRSYFYDAICLSLSMVLDSGVLSLISDRRFVCLANCYQGLSGFYSPNPKPKLSLVAHLLLVLSSDRWPICFALFFFPISEFQVSFTRKN